MSHSPQFEEAPAGLSKRAAQRLIQRALVLAARSRKVRQHIREADLTSVWTIVDWGLEWAVMIRRGKLDFDRRLPHQPDIRVAWPTAEAFFAQTEAADSSVGPSEHEVQPMDQSVAQYEGPHEVRRTWNVIHQAFRAALNELLQNPVDQDGRSLL
ncbi:MAG TPA: hypothetical protein VI455_09675 [Terriglobia bacterium]